jgi:hypothetical protein
MDKHQKQIIHVAKSIEKLEAQRKKEKSPVLKQAMAMVINREHDKLDKLKKAK